MTEPLNLRDDIAVPAPAPRATTAGRGLGRSTARSVRWRQSDEGFTLIELMVVVLIMGVLAAIAIPTFLTTRSGANDSAGQADVTNTVTNELSYYSTNKQFMGSAGGATLDPNLPWVTSGTTAAAAAANKVLTLTSTTYTAAQTAWTNSATATGQLVMLTMVLANSGKCWEAFSDQNAGNSRTLYAVDTGGCALPGATEPAAGGTGATGSAVADKSAGLVWDPTW